MLVLFLILLSLSFSQPVGNVEKYWGGVDIFKPKALRPVSVESVNGKLYVKDILRTKRTGKAIVKFIDNVRVTIFPESRLYILAYEKGGDISVKRGLVKFEVERISGKRYRIITNTAVIGVKGTVLWVLALPWTTFVYVEKGVVNVAPKINVKKSVSVRSGETVKVGAGIRPIESEEVKPLIVESAIEKQQNLYTPPPPEAPVRRFLICK